MDIDDVAVIRLRGRHVSVVRLTVRTVTAPDRRHGRSSLSLHHFTPSPGRPIDELLASYAAGTLSAPLQSLVAAHLCMKPDNRGFVAALEAMCGRAVEAAEPCAIRDRDAKLAAIFADEGPAPRKPEPPCAVLPPPLQGLLGRKLSDVPWRTRLPGIKEFKVSDRTDSESTLYWIRPGRVMPSHTHDGSEVTLVLRGGFSDPTGHYRRGDIAVADSELDHHPRADDDEDCICFAVLDAPLRLTGPVARLFQRFIGH